jgi:protein-L-isoaspartate(D-aspartate) O-methyltransferase
LSRADELNASLIDTLRARNCFFSDAVGEALRAVPRHHFLPNQPLEAVYSDRSIDIYDEAGRWLTVASQPAAIATTCEGAFVRPGHRVLDIGTGTGYLAGLLAHLAGTTGSVLSVDVVPELIETANERLRDLGLSNVTCQVHDAAIPIAGMFDAITVGATVDRIPPYWMDALTAGGSISAPTALSPYGNMLGFWRKEGTRLRGRNLVPCLFVPFVGPFAPLSATPSRIFGATRLRLRSTSSDADIDALSAGPVVRLEIDGLTGRDIPSFLYWLTLRASRNIIIESETEQPFDQVLGWSTGDIHDRTRPKWFGIGADAGLAVLALTASPMGPEDPTLCILGFGSLAGAERVNEELEHFLAAGRPPPHLVQVELDFDTAGPGRTSIDRGWARLSTYVGTTPPTKTSS